MDVVQRQRDAGIDITNDAEYRPTMISSVDYSVWWNYDFARLGSLEATTADCLAEAEVQRSFSGNIVLVSFPARRDHQRFAEGYADLSSGILSNRKSTTQPKVVAPLACTGHDLVASGRGCSSCRNGRFHPA